MRAPREPPRPCRQVAVELRIRGRDFRHEGAVTYDVAITVQPAL